MRVVINGQEKSIEPDATVAALLTALKTVPTRVAVEVNKQLVRRAAFDRTLLHDGDTIEVVTLVGGG